MAETFEAYRTRVLSYLGDEEPIGVQQATPSQLDRRLRDVAPEELSFLGRFNRQQYEHEGTRISGQELFIGNGGHQ